MEKKTQIVLAAACAVTVAALGAAAYVRGAKADSRNKDNGAVFISVAGGQVPVISFQSCGREMNPTCGYTDRERADSGRPDLTVLPEDRNLKIWIDGQDSAVTSARYEIRESGVDHLVERTDIKEINKDGDGRLTASLPIENLIAAGKEYDMTVILTGTGGQEIYYCTRILLPEKTPEQEEAMVKLAAEFSEKTFDKAAASSLTTYLEANEMADNSSLGHQTLKNNFDMLTWHNTGMQRPEKVNLHLRELAGNFGVVSLDYTSSISGDSGTRYYDVEESFTMRQGTERVYMMDYDRTVNQVFNGAESAFSDSRISLGVSDGTGISAKVSESGKVRAFTVNGTLWLQNADKSKTTQVWNSREKEEVRQTGDEDHAIRILNVDDKGNVDFAVAGYMTGYGHAGSVGTGIYHYDENRSLLTERVFIPSNEDTDDLLDDTGKLMNLPDSDSLYFLMNGTLYHVDCSEGTSEVVASGFNSDNFAVSSDSSKIAWQNGDSSWYGDSLTVMNFANGEKTQKDPEDGSVIRLVGFVGDDLVYGLGKSTDLRKSDGRIIDFPLYAVEIVNDRMEVETRYQKEGIAMTGVFIQDSRVHLQRAQKTAAGLTPIDEDTLVSNSVESGAGAGFGTYNDGVMGRSYYVSVTHGNACAKIRKPAKQEARSANVAAPESNAARMDVWYAYACGKRQGVYVDFADAVNAAWDRMGLVTDPQGRILWARANRKSSASISATGGAVSAAKTHVEDFIKGNRGSSDGTVYLDGRGLSLGQVLYFVSKGQPVAVISPDGSVGFIIAYDQFDNVTYLRGAGTEGATAEKIGINDATHYFSTLGNNYICFAIP